MIKLKYPLLGLGILLGACSSHAVKLNKTQLQDAVPQAEQISRYGNSPSYKVAGKRYRLLKNPANYSAIGIASWYGPNFHGKLTSNREKYNMYAMTAAHKTLPLPSYVKVINLENQRSVVVRVNDRGPFKKKRIIDLSYAAATKLDMLKQGTARVKVSILQLPVQPTLSVHQRYVQVGAFSSRDNAEKMRERLTKKDIRPIRIRRLYIEGKPLFRVQIGPLADDSAMENIHQRLAQWNIPSHFVKE